VKWEVAVKLILPIVALFVLSSDPNAGSLRIDAIGLVT